MRVSQVTMSIENLVKIAIHLVSVKSGKMRLIMLLVDPRTCLDRLAHRELR